jgi:subfamily B ATP-binding cassette protein MsbA
MWVPFSGPETPGRYGRGLFRIGGVAYACGASPQLTRAGGGVFAERIDACPRIRRKMKAYGRFLARILAYFRRDLPLIAALVVLIAASLAVDVLVVWPLSILVDVVFSPTPRDDWLYRAFLSVLPKDRLGQVVGLALTWLLLKVALETMFLCRMMINNRLKYSGTARVRGELFDHLLRQNLAYHRSRPQGDLIYRVTTDAWGFFGVLDTFIGAAVSAATLVAIAFMMLSRSVPVTVVTLAVAPPALVVVNL